MMIARVTASSSSFDVGGRFLICRVQFYFDSVPRLSLGIYEYVVRIH